MLHQNQLFLMSEVSSVLVKSLGKFFEIEAAVVVRVITPHHGADKMLIAWVLLSTLLDLLDDLLNCNSLKLLLLERHLHILAH
jgi:hypothetical protein